MNYTLLKKLSSFEQIIQELPLTTNDLQQIRQDREEIQRILRGEDDRLLMIIGPCSAWPEPAVIEYARMLAPVAKAVRQTMKVIMRVYVQKPRTTKGWTGPVNQPDIFASPNTEAGIRYARRMMLETIRLGLPIASEALFTHNMKAFLEMLSWVAIGARSAEDQEHRIFASALSCPVGMKNPTHGDLQIAINGIIAAQHPHIAVFDGNEIQTHGNKDAHLILRGANKLPNYDIHTLEQAVELMHMNAIHHPGIIIDASHDNCIINGNKDYRQQPQVIWSVLDSIHNHEKIRPFVKGFMMESFIKSGSQAICESHVDMGGLSITDPCLSFEDTSELLFAIHQYKTEQLYG